MVKIFSQTHYYEDAWPTVALAFFLRYPNRYASHVVSADVLSRTISPRGTLLTTRLILKRGALPAWFPRGMMSRAESWIVEESEVDPEGRVLQCWTRNLDHRTVMEVVEHTELREAEDGSTIHKTEARFVSGLGWGLKRRIEEYSATRFKANIEKSRLGLALVVRLLREARLQTLPFGGRMIQGQEQSDDGTGTVSTVAGGGARWSYSDITAAALASSSSFASSSSSTQSESQSQSQFSSQYNSSRDQSRRASPSLRDESSGSASRSSFNTRSSTNASSSASASTSTSTSASASTSTGSSADTPPAPAAGWGSWLWAPKE